MKDDENNVPNETIDRAVEGKQLRLSPAEQTRFSLEFETVKRNEGVPPIYGYIGAAAIIGLFFAKIFEQGTKDNISYILASLAVVNALIISSFSYSSLQIHELKQFQASHSDPEGAESEWEFNWRRTSLKSLTYSLRKWYYGTFYLFLGTISLFLITMSLVPTHHWRERWPAVLAILVHALPCRLLIQEIWVAQDRWTQIRKDMEARQAQEIPITVKAVSDERDQ
jgi:hypothetical protein